MDFLVLEYKINLHVCNFLCRLNLFSYTLGIKGAAKTNSKSITLMSINITKLPLNLFGGNNWLNTPYLEVSEHRLIRLWQKSKKMHQKEFLNEHDGKLKL